MFSFSERFHLGKSKLGFLVGKQMRVATVEVTVTDSAKAV